VKDQKEGKGWCKNVNGGTQQQTEGGETGRGKRSKGGSRQDVMPMSVGKEDTLREEKEGEVDQRTQQSGKGQIMSYR
jgi:hypothetical protein